MKSGEKDISTPRLYLRPLRPEDAADIFSYAQDPEVSRHTSWPTHQTLSDAQAFTRHVTSIQRDEPDALCVIWGIRLHESGTVIGTISFVQDDSESGHSDYALARHHWGQGLMTEAICAVMTWAFTQVPSLKVIHSGCLSRNIGSRRVLEKAGFRLERVEQVRFGEKFDNQILEVSYFAFERQLLRNVCDPDKALSISGSAGVLMIREDGYVALVKQTYKETLNIPGGIIEDGESPREACRREILEELALRIEDVPLLCADHLSASGELPERTHFIFFGGTLTPAMLGNLKLQASEISGLSFVPEANIPRCCSVPLAARLRVALDAYHTQKAYHIHDGLVSEAAQLGAEQ